MLECMEILSIASQKGIAIYAVKKNWQLDNTIQSKIIGMSFAVAAEIERDLISQRTKEVLAARKKACRSKGTGESKFDKHRSEIEILLANGSTQKLIDQRFNITEANLSRWLKKHGLRRHQT